MEPSLAFERKLYVIRKHAENAIRYNGEESGNSFYIASLSSRTVVYKGMLLANQVDAYYPDLLAHDMEAAIAVVHSRFSTNTFPSWSVALSIPLPYPQRRDQHDPRQYQLDVCAPVGAPFGTVRHGSGEIQATDHRP